MALNILKKFLNKFKRKNIMKTAPMEVALMLNESLEFYNNVLTQNGLENVFTITTHDIYLSNQSLEGLSENQIKNACIRLRSCYKIGEQDKIFKIQNNLCENMQIKEVLVSDLPLFLEEMEKRGYFIVIDTVKQDYHYAKPQMESRVQLQQIKDIGLVLYYDNPNYYHLPYEKQREALIEELNLYGFNFDLNTPDFNKLESLRDGILSFHENREGNSYTSDIKEQ